MANSKYEYVKNFERDETLLPNTWIVVRIDGRGFHQLTDRYNFTKPNDAPAIHLMNAAAVAVVEVIPEICIAYGVSDEYSFVFHRTTELFERRASKLITTVVSTFTAYYVHLWASYRPNHPLTPPWLPTFDGRAVCYPSIGNIRDYMTWRQVDCHINNLYNTTFWTLVQQGGMTTKEAEEALKGTVSSDKNEILFSRFGINYNNEPEMYKKGSIVFRNYTHGLEPANPPSEQCTQSSVTDLPSETTHIDPDTIFTAVPPEPVSKTQASKQRKLRSKAKVVVEHVDIIKDDFWRKRPWILGGLESLGKVKT